MAMKVNLKQWIVWLTIAFVVVFIYRDPSGASDAIGPVPRRHRPPGHERHP